MKQEMITLATAFIMWLSFTVYETSKSITLMEYQIEQIYFILQDISERDEWLD